MISRVINIGRWIVDFLFSTVGYDIDEVMAVLYEVGAPEWVIEQARDLMVRCDCDCGFTYSNQEEHRAVVFIGPTSSGSEFIDSLVHEVHHLAVAVASGLGVDLDGERPAYIAGDAARDLAEVVCELGCPCCHKETRQSED